MLSSSTKLFSCLGAGFSQIFFGKDFCMLSQTIPRTFQSVQFDYSTRLSATDFRGSEIKWLNLCFLFQLWSITHSTIGHNSTNFHLLEVGWIVRWAGFSGSGKGYGGFYPLVGEPSTLEDTMSPVHNVPSLEFWLLSLDNIDYVVDMLLYK